MNNNRKLVGLHTKEGVRSVYHVILLFVFFTPDQPGVTNSRQKEVIPVQRRPCMRRSTTLSKVVQGDTNTPYVAQVYPGRYQHSR